MLAIIFCATAVFITLSLYACLAMSARWDNYAELENSKKSGN